MRFLTKLIINMQIENLDIYFQLHDYHFQIYYN